MSEPIRDVETAVRALGALPMPVGPEPQSDPVAAGHRLDLLSLMDDRAASVVSPVLAAVLTEAEALRARVAELEAQRDRRRVRLIAAEADLLAVRGLLSPAGEPRRIPAEIEIHERVAPAVEWLLNRVAELEAAQGTVYRASHDSIPMGLYSTAAEARKHCEIEMRRDLPTVALDWIEDEEDHVAELVASVGEDERVTGYVVDALEVAAEYDEETDE
jgi:BMFP domain-containing protein YqiC